MQNLNRDMGLSRDQPFIVESGPKKAMPDGQLALACPKRPLCRVRNSTLLGGYLTFGDRGLLVFLRKAEMTFRRAGHPRLAFGATSCTCV